MARGINDVNLNALVLNRDVLCQNSNSALTLLIIGVQNSFLNLLVLAECIGCLEHLVNHGGFAVVNVGDDSNISDVVLTHKSLSLEGMYLDLNVSNPIFISFSTLVQLRSYSAQKIQ